MSICDESQITYEADGTQVRFTFPFEYLKDTDLWVGLWNEFSTRYEIVHYWPDLSVQPTVIAPYYWTLDNATTIRFVQVPTPPGAPGVPVGPASDWAPPGSPWPVTSPGTPADLATRIPNQENLIIKRMTSVDPLMAYFYPGSSIRAQDLNDNFEQLQMALEDVQCEASKNPNLVTLWGQQHDHSEDVWGQITFQDNGTGIDQHPEGEEYVIRWPKDPPSVVNMIMAVESIVGNIIQMKWVAVVGANFVIGGTFSSPNSIVDILGDGDDRFIDGGNSASTDPIPDSWPGTTGEPDYLDANPFPD